MIFKWFTTDSEHDRAKEKSVHATLPKRHDKEWNGYRAVVAKQL